MANLKFYKMAQAPVGTTEKPLEQGAIWFNSTKHAIEVYNGASWDVYTGVLDASYDNTTEKLVITNYNGGKVEIDFSIYATDEALNLLSGEVTTLKGTVTTQGGSITDLLSRMTAVEGKAATAEGQLAGLTETTVMAEIAKQVAAEAEIARAAEKALGDRVTPLETASADYKTRIETLEGKFTGEDSVAEQIADAVEAAEGRVDAKLANKADKATYEAYVAANDERVTAVEDAVEAEVLRATGAEDAINAKIGGNYGTGEGQVTVAADVQAAKDAAAEAQRTIDEFLTGEGIDPDKVENLKEIVKYIEDHGAEYSALVEDLGDLSDAIDLLNSDAETAGSVAKAVADAKTEINATIVANEKVTSEALTELDGRVDALEALSAGTEISDIKGRLDTLEEEVNTNIPQDIADAQAAAESTAAADATSKANTAESNAKGYADGLIAAEVTRSNKYADDAVAVEAAKVAANTAAISALDAKVTEGLAWTVFEQ